MRSFDAVDREQRCSCQRADEKLGNAPPEVTEEALVVKDKFGKPPSELGVRKSVECDTFFPSVL